MTFKGLYAAGLVALLCSLGCDRGDDNRGSAGDDAATTPGADAGDPADGDGDGDDGSGDDDGGDDGTPGGLDPLTPDQVDFYMRKLAPAIVGRSLSYDEAQQIQDEGQAAVADLLAVWTTDPGFANAMRDMVQVRLAVSGEREGVDFELPGNLVAQVVNDQLPWSTILTADYCVDADGNAIACDTGAPYEAGVLATRAFLISNKGRFNLSRAKRMLTVFGCRGYPMEMDVQVPLTKEILIPMFRAESEEEQEVEAAKGGFGNGSGCYSCHSQFGAHAQLFVKYDADGLWQETADGLQDPADELGRSLNDLYASHMDNPADSASEASQMFGEPVANLREAAEVIGDHPLFYSCSAKNLIASAVGLEAGTSQQIEYDLVARLGEEIMGASDDPTTQEIVTLVFSDEDVIRATVAALEEG